MLQGNGATGGCSELVSKLYEQGAFQLGEFTLKSGFVSPIYVDLRVLISSPSVLSLTADSLCGICTERGLRDFDYIVGVPYGAIALATLVSKALQKPMLMKRKEAKSYGTKQLIEGRFQQGHTALIVEDVITSGQSILETVSALQAAGLVCRDVLCVLDREQGGVERLAAHGISLHSVLTMGRVLDYLFKTGEIDGARRAEIETRMKSGVVKPEQSLITSPNSSWSLSARADVLAAGNALNKRLLPIMMSKKSNLCLAADLPTAEAILKVAEEAGDHICALKIHHDAIAGFNIDFVARLQGLADAKHFLLFEDRKYSDTANTMLKQLSCGKVPVAEWAQLVTVHSTAGADSVAALNSVMASTQSGKDSTLLGCLLVAELSTTNALTKLKGYVEETAKIGAANPHLVAGFICQKRCHNDPAFLYWTPGVNLDSKRDGLGQQWRGIETAIADDGCDIIIVGRGICGSSDVAAESKRYGSGSYGGYLLSTHTRLSYATAGWNAISKREESYGE